MSNRLIDMPEQEIRLRMLPPQSSNDSVCTLLLMYLPITFAKLIDETIISLSYRLTEWLSSPYFLI